MKLHSKIKLDEYIMIGGIDGLVKTSNDMIDVPDSVGSVLLKLRQWEEVEETPVEEIPEETATEMLQRMTIEELIAFAKEAQLPEEEWGPISRNRSKLRAYLLTKI